MESSELRIWNWVYDGECKMNLQIGTGLHLHRLHEDSLPIPLTEEWLVKFGAVKNEFYGTFSFGDYCIHIKDGGFNFMNDESSNAGCHYLCTIKYVHQLQNLYFALTGEELTIK